MPVARPIVTAQLLDGRLLDEDVPSTRKLDSDQQGCLAHCRKAPVKGVEVNTKQVQGKLLCPLANKPKDGEERCTLTPPRVAGVSLAPMLDHLLIDSGNGASNRAGGKRASHKGGVSNDRAVVTGPTFTAHRAAPIDSNSTTAVKQGITTQETPQLVAEGFKIKAVSGLQAEDGCCVVTASSVDALVSEGRHARQLAMYLELNESDSLCGTPPALPLHTITRESCESQGLGPLSPAPLTPSLLIVCNGSSVSGTQPACMWDFAVAGSEASSFDGDMPASDEQ